MRPFPPRLLRNAVSWPHLRHVTGEASRLHPQGVRRWVPGSFTATLPLRGRCNAAILASIASQRRV
jgi:hypothetical protein